jgi:hypothetical protein
VLEQGHSVIVSAPTSFGKSLLIEEVIASKQYNNIVIIQPTLALLDETRKKLEKYHSDYEIVVSTYQLPSLGRNIFLFTGERVVEYTSFPRIDFFVIDEFYKLSLERDDERAVTLNHALYRLLRMTNRFYFLGPNIRSITSNFVRSHNVIWHHSDYATVSVDIERLYEGKAWRERHKASNIDREETLMNLLPTLNEPTIIYCSTPDKATMLADMFTSFLSNANTSTTPTEHDVNDDIIEWIEENIHEKWALARALRKRIGFHHGLIPRHLASSMVDAFNRGDIRYLFCTSTLIEGVNTMARNVVLFDKKKGFKPIDFFDYKNIIGRSGRMNIHYVGRVYEFHKEPQQLELDVDLPLFSQHNAPLELLVQINESDVDESAKSRLLAFASLDDELKTIIRANYGLPVEGQIGMVSEIRSNVTHYHSMLRWTSIPSYDQLRATLELSWKYFLKPREPLHGVRNSGQLAVMSLQYNEGRSLQYLISKSVEYWMKRENEEAAIQKAVQLVLSTARGWFEYKLPKWLAGISELQAYAFRKEHRQPGNYSFFSSNMERSFIRGPLSILMDYDVPVSAIRKLENLFPSEMDWAILAQRLRAYDLDELGLLKYERDKIRAVLRT